MNRQLHFAFSLIGLMLVAAFATACATPTPTPSPLPTFTTAPPATPAFTPLPTFTPVPIATWIAQEIPPDTVINLGVNGHPDRFPYNSILLTADGTVVGTGWSLNQQSTGKIAQTELKQILAKLAEVNFFALATRERGCIYDANKPPTASVHPTIMAVADGTDVQISIHLKDASISLTSNPGCIYDIQAINRFDAVWVLVYRIASNALSRVGPETSITRATPRSECNPFSDPGAPPISTEAIRNAVVDYINSHMPESQMPQTGYQTIQRSRHSSEATIEKSGDWIVSILASPYRVTVTNERAGFSWEGNVATVGGYRDSMSCRWIEEHVASVTQVRVRVPPSSAASFFKRGRDSVEWAPERAIADLTEAIKLKTDFDEAYLYRGRAYVAKSNYALALADYDQAIKLNPNFADAYYSRGVLHQIMGEKTKAIADYKKYIELGDNLVLIENAKMRIKELEAQ